MIYDLINSKEDVKAKFEKLVESTNEDLEFSKNHDGSMAVYVKYKNYNIAINLKENEVFQYALQRDKRPGEAIEDKIKEKLLIELLKEKE